MYAVLAELDVFSLISTFVPLASTSTDVYPLPPPTTLVGALAYPYVKHKYGDIEIYNDASPAILLLNKVLYVAAGIPNDSIPIVSKGVERTYQHIYLRRKYWSEPGMAYTVSIRPVVQVDKIYGLYIVKDEAIDLVKYVFGIVRVGRKESLVAVRRVTVRPLHQVLTNLRECETRFYFPSSIASSWSRENIDGVIMNMPILCTENFRRTEPKFSEFVVPAKYSIKPIHVIVNENGVIASINGFCIPIPRGVLNV